MRIHTDDYKNALVGVRETDEYLRYIQNGVWKRYNKDDLVLVKPILNATLFKTVMKELDIETKTKIEVGTAVDYKIGLKVEDDYDYVFYGRYTVYEVEYRPDTKTYYHICYDRMLNAMKPYETPNITFPISVNNYILAIAGKTGLLGHTPSIYEGNYTNHSKTITKDYFTEGNYTYRDVLDYLCEVVGGWLYIDNNNDLKLKYPTETHEVFNEDYLNYINVSFEKKYGPVNSVVLARSNELDNIEIKNDESIAENGLWRVKFSDNPLLSDENREDYIQELANQIMGLEFYLNDLESKGITYLELGDLYTFKISEETINALKSGLVKSGIRKAQGNSNYYKCLMLNDETEFRGGIKELIFTDEPEETNTEYITTSPSDNSLKNAEILVNKNAGELVLKANSDGQVVQARLDADADDGSLFEVKADNIKLEGYTTINGNFSVDLEGNMTCRNANVTGGRIDGAYLELTDSGGASNACIEIINNNSALDGRGSLSSNMLEFDGNGHLIYISTDSVFDSSTTPFVDFDRKFTIYQNGNAFLSGTLTQGSKEELKKDFEKYENALDEIKKIDIYKYRFKTEKDNSKKHIGFIIGDKYNYSQEITSDNNDGVDLYSFVSVCCKAIQEQQEQIEELKKEIKSLKESDK